MAISDRRKREREQRRNEIIDAAEKLFFANDYDDVTMDGIANEAEVNKALLYYYFKSKEALFFAVNLRVAQMIHSMYVKCSELDEDGMHKLVAMGQSIYEFSKEYPDHLRLYSYAGSKRFRNAKNDNKNEATKLGMEIWNLIIETFMQGIDEGTIRDDLDPVEMSVYITLISLSAMGIDPDPSFKMVLESRGISQDKFLKDLLRFIIPALTNRHLSNLENAEINSIDRK